MDSPRTTTVEARAARPLGAAFLDVVVTSLASGVLISLFCLVAVALGSAGIVAQLLGVDVPILVYLPILPFELTIGTWLLIRGIRTSTEPPQGVGVATASSTRPRTHAR